jgi:mRNA interferase RelE/StbE
MTSLGNNIFFHPRVIKEDIPSIGKNLRERIQKAIETKLSTSPETYGEPLRGVLKPYWKLRVRDWRIVYLIERGGVFVLAIAHRNRIYTDSTRRFK